MSETDDAAAALLAAHVARFNAGFESGDWSAMVAGFADDAELVFEGVPVGPFAGRKAIAAAYAGQPPDDAIDVLETRIENGSAIAVYGWRRDRPEPAGRLILTPRGGLIGQLIVTFDTWNSEAPAS